MVNIKRIYICKLCKKRHDKKKDVHISDVGYICKKCIKPSMKLKGRFVSKVNLTDLKKECDDLWSEIVKKKAGYKSEISKKKGRQVGGESILHAHHIVGKPNYRLRYELKNGVCLTAGEHKFGIHNQGRQQEYEDRIRKAKGHDCYTALKVLKWAGKSDLRMIREYLLKELGALAACILLFIAPAQAAELYGVFNVDGVPFASSCEIPDDDPLIKYNMPTAIMFGHYRYAVRQMKGD